jgi:hypothetical protein
VVKIGCANAVPAARQRAVASSCKAATDMGRLSCITARTAWP